MIKLAAYFATVALLTLVVATGRGTVTASGDPESLHSRAQGRLAQVSGSLAVPGLKNEVRVVRDRWGVPHIYASNTEDLFFAQGFVQAQDRLFQMDFWKRSTSGHLAEILGPHYTEADRMSRLLQYRGDLRAEWSSYSPEGEQIIARFVDGINAWVTIAKKNPPLEFTLAGIEPSTWQPQDVLSRSEGFIMSYNATAEVFRARLTAAVGTEQSEKLLPPDPLTTITVPSGLDLSLIDAKLADILGKIGAGASGFGQNLRMNTSARAGGVDTSESGSNNWVVNGARSVTGQPLLANDPHRALDHPSLRYIVHLKAPGWNVIGATQPWLPGVSLGHNDRVAWGATLFQADTQDLYVEKLNPRNDRQYEGRGKWIDMTVKKEQIRVKGRSDLVVVELQYTVHGPVVAVDREKHIAFVLRTTSTEPGTAGYLAGIGIDRAVNAKEFRENLRRWKLPGENVLYADLDGNIGYQAAVLIPIRTNWSGMLPVPGAAGEFEWSGWFSLDDLPHGMNPQAGYFATANNNTLPPGEKRVINYQWSDPARVYRIREVLNSKQKFTIGDFQRLQHDAVAWKGERLVPLLSKVTAGDAETERARKMLVDWDRNLSIDSAQAAVYVIWEQKLQSRLASGKVEGPLASEYLGLVGRLVVPKYTAPDEEWFGPTPLVARDKLLLAALADAVVELKGKLGPDMRRWKWGALHSATFRHLLATDPDTQKLLNIGPFSRAGYSGTVFNTGGRGFEQHNGSSYRQILDLAEWDRSIATSAPGQSGQPGSPHFDDLARLWAEEKYFPLAFSDRAVHMNAESTLTLTPAR